ncbi:CRISPR-associated protein [Sulfurimonas sp. SAG-AH-194-C21]|nr:CRISPR-associated protein [Sulfurimonas sp. SAG-AH-194-C21]MDF1884322.1 CRISPR-associated protein [Sulfurimonas sp. SAG-AH-194-C21]
MTLKYTLEFFDYWHLSSGLSAGAKLDSTVVKDENNLPYASGKTMKGLVREMTEEFGEIGFLHQAYFSNATLNADLQEQIVSNKLQDNLYDIIASTKIDSDGIAVDNSLREIEVVVPIILYGEVRDIPEKHIQTLVKSLKLIKRMGLNRNRGLGRCEFSVEKKK